MFTEKGFDRYNEAMRDLRNTKYLANVITAFELGLKKTPRQIKIELTKAGKTGWYSLAAIVWDGIEYVVKIEAGAILIFGVVGGVAGSAVPIPGAGTAVGAGIGARIGAAVASWYLGVVGLASLAAITGQISGTVSVYFETGIRKASSGDVDGGANEIAKGFAKVLEIVAAIIILLCFIRGGRAVIGKIKTKFAKNTKLFNLLKSVPKPLTNLQTFYRSAKWGYAYAEIKALQTMSRNGRLYVIRACNPGRTKVGKGNPLPGKGLEIKGKSIENGIYEGQVGVIWDDIVKLKKNYDFEPIELRPGLQKLRVATMAARKQYAGTRLRLKPGKTGDLDNHIIESTRFINTSAADSRKMFRLLDPKGNPYIPDMDRLVCMKIDLTSLRGSSVKLKDLARFGDDPKEIARFNRELNALLGTERVNYYSAMHGYTSSNIDSNGKPIWHADSNETLIMAIDGKVFEVTWNQFVLFCEANKSANMPQCFKQIQ